MSGPVKRSRHYGCRWPDTLLTGAVDLQANAPAAGRVFAAST